MKQKQSRKITDEFWEEVKHLIPIKHRNESKEYKRKPGGGRKPIEPRKALEAIFYVLQTGIQWKALLKEFGASSTIHRYFQFWCEQGFFEAIWRAGLERYDEIQGIDWSWLSGDGSLKDYPLQVQNAHEKKAHKKRFKKEVGIKLQVNQKV